jgi:flagellar basal-body rod protein FlgC
MAVRAIASPIDIAVSGLRAESTRMNVITANIANANTTRAADGQPYRRQEVVVGSKPGDVRGVSLISISPDLVTQFKKVHDPGHPDADKDGNVLMPNVDLPTEMIDMVTASRAYQANAVVLKRFQDLSDVTLELLK